LRAATAAGIRKAAFVIAAGIAATLLVVLMFATQPERAKLSPEEA
jgi:hypothetical protein